MNLRPKQRLELANTGKDARPKLKRRILLEDPAKSHYANRRVTENDIFDSRLIFGDNMPVLKSQEQDSASEAKFVFIDPVAAVDYIEAHREQWDNQERGRAHE